MSAIRFGTNEGTGDSSVASANNVLGSQVKLDPNGDIYLAVSGLGPSEGITAIQVSSAILAERSCILGDVTSIENQHDGRRLVYLDGASGDAIYLLCAILHQRHDLLPACITPETLLNLVDKAYSHQCLESIKEAASVWLGEVFRQNKETVTFQMIQACLFLDNPLWFARFTSRYVRKVDMQSGRDTNFPLAGGETAAQQKLCLELRYRQGIALLDLANDLRSIHSYCNRMLTSEEVHYRNDPDATETTPDSELCQAEKYGSLRIIGLMRDHWSRPASGILDKGILNIELICRMEPDDKLGADYEDDGDGTDFCTLCDHFANVANARTRSWGLCLDCFQAGARSKADCRVPHRKQDHRLLSDADWSQAVSELQRAFERLQHTVASLPLLEIYAFTDSISSVLTLLDQYVPGKKIDGSLLGE